jgi:hypothetical protein
MAAAVVAVIVVQSSAWIVPPNHSWMYHRVEVLRFVLVFVADSGVAVVAVI